MVGNPDMETSCVSNFRLTGNSPERLAKDDFFRAVATEFPHTPTLKLRRRIIEERYKKQIDELYTQAEAAIVP